MRRHPQPEFRQHRTVSEGDFAPGTAIAQADTARAVIPCASAQKVRVRLKTDVGGELTGAFLLPGLIPGDYAKFDEELDGTARVTTSGNPAAVTVVGGTEAVLEVDCVGEAYLLVEFTEENVAAGTIEQLSHSQL